ncbi:hypothetical protein AB1K89_09175 [Sporosarcina sp. 179-K 8C2 HS]|uniref:hypothetical protein n=1 Tax=Sporosarcina sp. 179-K 8C2 HS TaxID=3142387 RepID=UPI0039A1A3A7
MNKDFIEIHQSFWNEPIWTEATPEQTVILVTLLLIANSEEQQSHWKGEPMTLQPGQLITSLRSLVSLCGKGITEQDIRTALKRFADYGFLTAESNREQLLITILNWGEMIKG